MTILNLGQSVTNSTGTDMEVHVKYLNCFGLWQTDIKVLKPGQTFTKTKVSTKISYMQTLPTNRHIWEGWTVHDFIEELDAVFPYKRFSTKEELKKWCKNEQPYYKKHIPEVYNYFLKKSGL